MVFMVELLSSQEITGKLVWVERASIKRLTDRARNPIWPSLSRGKPTTIAPQACCCASLEIKRASSCLDTCSRIMNGRASIPSSSLMAMPIRLFPWSMPRCFKYARALLQVDADHPSSFLFQGFDVTQCLGTLQSAKAHTFARDIEINFAVFGESDKETAIPTALV